MQTRCHLSVLAQKQAEIEAQAKAQLEEQLGIVQQDGETLEDAARRRAQEALDHPDWVQVGMDPERHSYFYDRATMRPVTEAEEALQIGPLVLAKKPRYGDPEDFPFKDGGLAAKPVWEKKRPKDLGKPKSLSVKKKKSAKARAKAAGRPYPNLVDNMAAAKKKGK